MTFRKSWDFHKEQNDVGGEKKTGDLQVNERHQQTAFRNLNNHLLHPWLAEKHLHRLESPAMSPGVCSFVQRLDSFTFLAFSRAPYNLSHFKMSK